MADKIQWASNTMPKSDDKHLGIMSLDHVKKARAFHQSFPQYTCLLYTSPSPRDA